MGKFAVVFGIVLIAVLAVSWQRLIRPLGPGTPVTPSPTPQEAFASPTSPTVAEAERSRLLQGGSSYADPNGIFSMLYPADFTLDTQAGNMVRLTKRGVTQRGQTEMYDGVIMTFEPITLPAGQTLPAFIDSAIREATSDGSAEVTKPITPIRVNANPGFTYAVRSLGESSYTVIQKSADSPYAVRISILMEDPGEVGFQRQVEAILSTVTLMK